MARLMATIDGQNWTDASWALLDPTAYLNNEAASTYLTTSYTPAPPVTVYTPGAITIDGMAVKVYVRASSPSGLFKVRLWNSTAGAAVDGTECTVNVSDILSSLGGIYNGWFFFKFAAPVVLLAGNNYAPQAMTTVSSQVSLYSSSSTVWSFFLRTTTLQAPVAGDDVVIGGEWTGPATKNSIQVVMNNTTTTDFGSANTSSVIPAIAIVNGGTLTCGTADATNYRLRVSGYIIVYAGGNFYLGTVATPIPSSSKMTLEFDCAADGQFGFIVRSGTFILQGAPRTTDRCFISADEPAGQTVLSVDRQTDWVNGDVIALASSTANPSHSEQKTVSTSDATTVTVTSGTTYVHYGPSTNPVANEVVLLTRNVVITVTNINYQTGIYIIGNVTVDVDWVEFAYFGTNASSQYCFYMNASSPSSISVNNCSFHHSKGRVFNLGDTAPNSVYSNNVLFSFSTSYSSDYGFYIPNNPVRYIENNIIIGTTSAYGIYIATAVTNLRLNNNYVSGVSSITAITFGSIDAINLAEFNNNVVHASNYGFSIYTTTNPSQKIHQNNIIYKCSVGITIYSTPVAIKNITFSNCKIVGCSSYNLYLVSGSGHNVVFDNCQFSGLSTQASSIGAYLGWYCTKLTFSNCTFGATGGIYTNHTSADIACYSSQNGGYTYLTNTILNSPVEFGSQTNLDPISAVFSQRHDQVAGSHKTWKLYGTIQTDTTAYSGMPSKTARMIPNTATASAKLVMPIAQRNVANGGTVTISVQVRESVAGDGTDYNGARVRLLVLQNNAMGIADDTVLATATAASEGAVEVLTGVTTAVTADGALQFAVDCGGNGTSPTGWVNIGNVTFS